MAATGATVALLVCAGALAYVVYDRNGPQESALDGAALHGGATTLSMGVVSGAPAVPMEAPIRLANAQGLGSASLSLTYDPAVVSIVDVLKGDVPQSALTWNHDASAGTLVLLLTTSLPAGASGDDTLAVVTLLAKEGAVGQVSPLAVEVRSAVHADGEAMTIRAEGGSFRNGVPGDVTGNGVVDEGDYQRIADFLVGKDVTIVALNADLDGDGSVTESDAVRLHQMLDG